MGRGPVGRGAFGRAPKFGSRVGVPMWRTIVLRAQQVRLDEHGQPTERRRLGEPAHLRDDLRVKDAVAAWHAQVAVGDESVLESLGRCDALGGLEHQHLLEELACGGRGQRPCALEAGVEELLVAHLGRGLVEQITLDTSDHRLHHPLKLRRRATQPVQIHQLLAGEQQE